MNLRLFFRIAGIEARKRMSYRADFWMNTVVALVVQVGIATFIMQAVYRELGTNAIGGYTLRDVTIYFVIVSLVGKLVTATQREQDIAQDIYEGGLTRYLLYPTSYPIVKYAQQLGATAPVLFQIVIFGAWMPFVFGMPSGLSPSSVVMGAIAIVMATLLEFLLLLPIQAVAFWADNVWSLGFTHRIASQLLGGLLLPLNFFPDGLRHVLEILPYRFLFSFPVEALLGRLSWDQWVQGMGIAVAWCLVLAAVGRAVWRRGNFQYTGVGI